MKDSVKLNSAMLEQAECMLAGSKNKELIDNVLDNLWHLINESSLQPTHKQEMTSVIMNLRRDRDMGQYMILTMFWIRSYLCSAMTRMNLKNSPLCWQLMFPSCVLFIARPHQSRIVPILKAGRNSKTLLRKY